MRPARISRMVVAFLASLNLVSLGFAQGRSAVQPRLLYAIDNGDNALATFNLKAQTVTVIGSLGPQASEGALALAFCPQRGLVGLVAYTIVNSFDPTFQQLATLDLATGAATVVGSPLPPLPSGQALDIMGMTCSREGTLYVIGDFDPSDPNFNSLYTIDRETGQPTLIGSTGIKVPPEGDPAGGFGFFMALDFAPDGTLYGANDFALYRIEPSTGQATEIVPFVGVTQPPAVMGLAISSDSHFYIADYQPLSPGLPASRVYRVNTNTGLATPVLNTGLNLVHNIAFRIPF